MDRPRASVIAATIAALVLASFAACGRDGSETGADDSPGSRPTIVVTTGILGDAVSNLVGDQAGVVTIMPSGVDPHSFQASAQEAAAMQDADALVVNGAGFEGGLLDVVEAAADDGVPVFEAMSAVERVADDRADGEHADDGDDHDVDPHFFTDPQRMVAAVEGIADFLAAEVPAIDDAALRVSTQTYVASLEELDREIEETLAAVPEERRVLVTSHQVFGYFADRYGFEVIGTIVPGGTTDEAVGAGELAELAEAIEESGVPAVFVDSSAPAGLAQTLADEVGRVAVVELFSESLGEEGSGGETYIEMMRTNARRIADTLS